MQAPEATETEPAGLRLLRRLVTALLVVMILGVISLVGLVVIRFAQPRGPILPESIALPADVSAFSVTIGPDWFGVVTEDGRLLIYDSTTSELLRDVTITRD